MLLLSRNRRLRILELPIRTIYLDGNASSHFNPLLDSMRIYFVLLRFAMISMFTAVLDNLLFSAVYAYTGSKATSQIVGRLGAMTFNFATVKRMVFNSRGRVMRELAQYTALVAISGTISYGMIVLFTSRFGMGVSEIQTACRRHSLPGQFPRAARHHLHRRQGSRVAGSPCRLRPPPRPPPICRDERHSAAP